MRDYVVYFQDRLQPDVICPRDVTVNAALGKHTAEVSWSVKTTDNSVSVEPSAHVSVSSSYTSPHTFPIGRHIVGVKATDRAGNSQHCDFHVTVKGEYGIASSFGSLSLPGYLASVKMVDGEGRQVSTQERVTSPHLTNRAVDWGRG